MDQSRRPQATETSEQRVASWPLGQSELSGADGRITLKSTKKVLAEDLGMTPETLSRVLSRFRRDEILEVHRREIVIRSPDRLRELV